MAATSTSKSAGKTTTTAQPGSVLCQKHGCGGFVPPHLRCCPSCNTHASFPNVRACESPLETAKLHDRYRDAKRVARQQMGTVPLKRFEQAMKASKTIICRPANMLRDMLENGEPALVSYYKTVRAGIRSPTTNYWDSIRESADAAIHPYFYEEMMFGALSLNDLGAYAYGECNLILKTAVIAERSSVFDSNSTELWKKLRDPNGTINLAGYRSDWAGRIRLAVAKLGSKFNISTRDDQFPTLLNEATKINGDFVEVQIYGNINIKSIEKVIYKSHPARMPDRLIWKSVKKKLADQGFPFEEQK